MILRFEIWNLLEREDSDLVLDTHNLHWWRQKKKTLNMKQNRSVLRKFKFKFEFCPQLILHLLQNVRTEIVIAVLIWIDRAILFATIRAYKFRMIRCDKNIFHLCNCRSFLVSNSFMVDGMGLIWNAPKCCQNHNTYLFKFLIHL